MSKKTFIAKCIRNEALLTDIDDYVDKWHETEQEAESLHEFLGMTWEEYSIWVAEPEVLPYIVTAHEQNVSLETALGKTAHAPSTAKEAPVVAKKIIDLLKKQGKLHP